MRHDFSDRYPTTDEPRRYDEEFSIPFNRSKRSNHSFSTLWSEDSSQPQEKNTTNNRINYQSTDLPSAADTSVSSSSTDIISTESNSSQSNTNSDGIHESFFTFEDTEVEMINESFSSWNSASVSLNPTYSFTTDEMKDFMPEPSTHCTCIDVLTFMKFMWSPLDDSILLNDDSFFSR